MLNVLELGALLDPNLTLNLFLSIRYQLVLHSSTRATHG